MESGDTTSLIAWTALVVSVLSAGFTGWQAVTAHLARTRQPPATWAIVAVPPRWVIHNLGGSAANDIEVEVMLPSGPGDDGSDVKRRSEMVGPLAAGAQCDIYWPDGGAPDPRVKFAPRGDGKLVPVTDDEPGARYVIAEKATVTWLDYRGKPRSAKVRLR